MAEPVRRRFSRFRRGALVIVIATVIALLLAEVAVRVAGVHGDASLFTADPELGWGLRAGAHGWNISEGEAYVRVNRHGQMDAERTIAKPAGVFRIAVLGDSMVEARQVPLEQRFTQVTERLLGQCAGRPVEVLNFGVPGYGTAQEWMLLRSRVWAYQPDLILLGVYFGNDLYDNFRQLDHTGPERRPFYVRNGDMLKFDATYKTHPSMQPTRIRLRNFAADLMNSSALATAINQVRVGLRGEPEGLPSTVPGGPPADYRRRWIYLEPKHPWHVEAWLTTEALIRAVRDEVASRNAGFAIIYMPMMMETDSDLAGRDAFVQSLGAEGSIDYPRNRLIALATKEAIRMLDPTKRLLDYAVANHVFVNGFKNTPPNAGHLNEQGHREVAAFLSDAICADTLAAKRTPYD